MILNKIILIFRMCLSKILSILQYKMKKLNLECTNFHFFVITLQNYVNYLIKNILNFASTEK